MGESVQFKSNGDHGIGYLATPTSGSGPGVILLQEWWGMVPHITDVADRLAAAGFTTLVPDLYRGASSNEPDEAMKMMMGMSLERAGKDMSGAIDFLQERCGPGVGVIGFCMGGGLALVLACQRADAVQAVVPFYGLIPWANAQPDYTQLAGAVQGHYAERDHFASPVAARALEQQLRDLGNEVEMFVYDGTDHAFFNDERPEVYNADAANTAWDRTIAFLSANLGPETTDAHAKRVAARAEARAARVEQLANQPAPSATEDPSDHRTATATAPATPGHPAYRGGHWDTNLAEFPLLADYGVFKTGWMLIGEAEDGPSVAVVKLAPGVPEDHAHFHNSAQVRIITEGSMRIGNIWYSTGDIRVQQPGVPYGPEEVGPDGVSQLLFWSDRRGMFPHYRKEHAEARQMGLDGFANLMASTGVEAN